VTVEEIMDEVGTQQGWNTDTRCWIALEYVKQVVEDHDAIDDFEAFVRAKAEEENAGTGE